jgi:hypothetical protein
MQGIVIQYAYSGDEAEWKSIVDGFVADIDTDPKLKGLFSYEVNVAADGVSRVHIGRWEKDETLAYLQSQDFFKAFAAKVQGFASDGVSAQRFGRVTSTSGV